ncbi:hypothetical protein [Kitasatospora herbaricolor]|uniref:Uncharacterized protein n=1 Tax=Kitasatospora herbaricolor TaxID=68217 RepID=A0ABZ1WHM8_9ACTN|nr:hypothetical protein [Kitasatospora herbaricolor]
MSTATEAAGEPSVEFEVPPDFVPFEQVTDADAAAAVVLARLGTSAAGLGADHLPALTELYLDGSAALVAAGTIWSGTAFGSIDGAPSTAVLTVAGVDTGPSDRRTAAAGLLSVLTTEGEAAGAEVREFTAPAGPVVVTVRTTPGWEVPADGGGTARIPLLRAQGYLPLPGPGGGVLVVDLTTPDLAHWEDAYAPLFTRVLRSIDFPPERAQAHAPPAPAPAGEQAPDPFGTALTGRPAPFRTGPVRP